MDACEVSVVIPTHNRRRQLPGAIDSVLGQSWKHCHVLVVDDGSSDGTAQLVADRYGSNERVRYLPQERNRGVASARNLGLTHAPGEYIAFLDSDDRWKSWKLEAQVGCLARLAGQGVGMIWTDIDAVDDQGQLLGARAMRREFAAYHWIKEAELFAHTAPLSSLVPGLSAPGADTAVHWGDAYSQFVLGNLCQPSSVMLTRQRALETGPFDETMLCGEDHPYHLRCARAGPVALLDAAAVLYRQGAPDQLTNGPLRLQDAENHLRTLLPAIATDRERIRVSAKVLRHKLAEAYAWAAQENLDYGSAARARRLCGTSLSYRPLQGRTWAVLVAATLEPQAREQLRHAYRQLKRVVRRGP
jgi:GT2 family glycosyltransferase